MNEIKVNMENLTDEQQNRLMELIKVTNEPVDRPIMSKPYFYIDDMNQIITCIYYGFNFDKIRFEAGNAFIIEKEAEFEQEKRKVIAELKNYAKKHNDKIIDWNNFYQDKWSFYYDYKYKELKYSVNRSCREYNNIYFSSDIICNSAIIEIGENRIKKYLFEVE